MNDHILEKLRVLRDQFNTGKSITISKTAGRMQSADAAKTCQEAIEMLELLDRILTREMKRVRELEEKHKRAVISLTNPLKNSEHFV